MATLQLQLNSYRYTYDLQNLVLLLLVVAALLTSASLCAASKNNQQQLNQLRDQIKSIQNDILSKEAKKREVADALQKSERAISSINRRLAILSEKKRALEVSFKQAGDHYGKIQVTIAELQEQLNNLLYFQYLQGQPTVMRLLLNQQDPNQIARHLYYTERLSQARLKSIESLQQQLAEVSRLKQIIQQKRKAVRTVLAQQSIQKKKLSQEKSKRAKLLAQISADIVRHNQDIGKLKRDEQRLSALSRELYELTSYSNSDQVARQKNLSDNSSPGRLFAALKGSLRLPVAGELVSRFGSPRAGANIFWKGLFIRSPSGSAVKAIAAGRIVFADWLRGFGNLIIIDHGDSYMSLYGNNETLYKEVGEIIRRGDTIAAVGNSGGNLDSGLYFELRYQGKPFDPMGWVNNK